ncbi:MAG: DnaD domain protein [Mycoplasmataceae bacterium]|nr:DnaD domain protein [Mycoplasmataceae bacterium]
MKLEQNELSMLFSSTNIPDVFFTEYLSEASGDFIKVYLYMLFLSKYGKDIKLNDLSKKIALPLTTIQAAIKYWEEAEVITKKGTGYIVNNIQEIELNKLYSPKLTVSKESIQNMEKDKSRASAIEAINNMFFQGIMSPSWYSDIDLWFKRFEFDEEVMIALFQYCFDKSALHKNYVKAVADAWHGNNIKTFSDLEEYDDNIQKIKKVKKNICKKLGLTRNLTQYEEAYIEKWLQEYKYDLEIIELALKKTTSKSNPNFDYIDKIISDWHDRKLLNSEDVKNYLLDFKNKSKQIKELEKKTGYQNYDQRDIDNFDKFYANN